MNPAVAWSAVEAISAALLSVVSSLAIARLLGPAELGVGAAIVAVHVPLWVAVNALFADALVQRASVDGRILSSAFWASTAVGVAAMVAMAASGWGLGWLLDDRRLVPMALALAAPLPFVGAAGVMQGVLTRARAYRRLALRTLVGQGLGAVIGIVAAARGAGAWAVVAQQAAASLFGALTLLVWAGWRPTLAWDGPALRALLRIGLPLTGSTLAQIARYRLFILLIGASAGTAALGQVHIAFRLVDTVREVAFTALWRLMLPVLSACQHDRAAMLARVDWLLRRSCGVMLPLCLGLAALLPSVVALLLGPRWTPAAQAALPLVALMAGLTLMFPSGVALVAAGQGHFTLYANLAGLVTSAAGALLLRPADPWQAVLVWCGGQAVVTPYALWVNGRALGVGLLRPVMGGWWGRMAQNPAGPLPGRRSSV